MTSSPLVISTHHIGIPQIRERVIIAGYHKSLNIKNFNIELPKKDDYKNDIDTILDKEVDKKYNITNHEERILECWNHFIKGIKYIPKKSKS
ncbi:DNA cytosine methyltransferase [Mycoplasmopsis felis]|uniref:DNA cytosine methyltransferase n=1 Tax=Mycoplasmopsis felis TaxID=33923 RepID=UPI003A5C7E2F